MPPSSLSTEPLPVPSRVSGSFSFTVRNIDCDANHHLNHVRMIQALLSLAGEWKLSDDEIAGIEAEFLTQALEGETLDLCFQEPCPDSGRPGLLWARREDAARPAAILTVHS